MTTIDLPSALQRGAETPRSRSSAAFTRVAFADPSAGAIARCSWLYAPHFFSSPSRNASHFPSGDHSTLPPRPPPLAPISLTSVIAFSAAPGWEGATYTCAPGVRSGSSRWLLVNAIHFPSGDQEGPPSSHFFWVVRRSVFFVARSKM